MDQEKARRLLKDVLDRMVLINGPYDECALKNWSLCGNHAVMREIEEFLQHA